MDLSDKPCETGPLDRAESDALSETLGCNNSEDCGPPAVHLPSSSSEAPSLEEGAEAVEEAEEAEDGEEDDVQIDNDPSESAEVAGDEDLSHEPSETASASLDEPQILKHEVECMSLPEATPRHRRHQKERRCETKSHLRKGKGVENQTL